MRLFIALLPLFVAVPAAAFEIPETQRWTAEAHVMRGQISHDTILRFERIRPGAWVVLGECQVTDTLTKGWTAHKGSWRAGLQGERVTSGPSELGSFILADGKLTFEDSRCASGEVTLGTGD